MTIGSVGFDRTIAGEASSCGCAMCRPVSYLPQAAWSNPQAPREWTPQLPEPPPFPGASPAFPTRPELIRARVMALVQGELDALPAQIMPVDWRWSLVHRTLLRLREAVQAMDLTA